jgi:alkylation response protein AidB-like acyl-CoA dehydrogenase
MTKESLIAADFGFGEDQEMLPDTARKLLDERIPVERLRKLVADDETRIYDEGERPGWDEALWKEIVELGWTTLAVPEQAGGVGFNLAGIVGLLEEVGRHALPSPLVSTIMATLVLREAELETSEPWLGRIAAGAAASLAHLGPAGEWELLGDHVVAREASKGFVLEGRAHFVQDAFKSELLVCSARLGQADLLFVVPVDTPGLHLEQNQLHDLTRDQATVHFESARVSPDALVSQQAEAVLRRARPALLASVAADLCGCGEWQLQTTVEYARTRKQFDRPIGFFQAVKHPLVDAMIAIDRARSLNYQAAACIDAGAPEAERYARMAKSAASDAGAFISDRSIQLHGGIGFTWESDLHIFFKRSLHNQVLYGDGVHHRRELANQLIGPIESPATDPTPAST